MAGPHEGTGITRLDFDRARGGAATRVVGRDGDALLVIALPALGMHLQDPAQTQSLPRSVPAVDAALRMPEAFPGTPTPARVVIWDSRGGSLDTSQVSEAIDGLHARVATSGGLLAEPISVVKVDHVLVARVPLAGAGTDATSNKALETLRNEILPATFGQLQGIDYAVGGRTATPHDFAERMTSRAPIVFAFVLVLAFGLLFLAFRSLTIPVISILLNLLSIGTAYGVLTWVFQDGHLGGLLSFTAYGGVVGWLPMFIFVLLFGLSMDYHIFILSRIRERGLSAATGREAIIGGIGGHGRRDPHRRHRPRCAPARRPGARRQARMGDERDLALARLRAPGRVLKPAKSGAACRSRGGCRRGR